MMFLICDRCSKLSGMIRESKLHKSWAVFPRSFLRNEIYGKQSQEVRKAASTYICSRPRNGCSNKLTPPFPQRKNKPTTQYTN